MWLQNQNQRERKASLVLVVSQHHYRDERERKESGWEMSVLGAFGAHVKPRFNGKTLSSRARVERCPRHWCTRSPL